MNVTLTVEITPTTCHQCGVVFGMSADVMASRRRDGGTFYCTNGHPAVFRETEAQKLQKEVQRERQLRDQAEAATRFANERRDAAERRERAAKGQATKLKKRYAAGTCPCCNRFFDSLERHIHNEHPDFKVEAATEKAD